MSNEPRIVSVLDCSLEDFKELTARENLGSYKTHLVLITLHWERLGKVRSDAMKVLQTEHLTSAKKQEFADLISSVYSKMISLEEKAVYLRGEIQRIENLPIG